MSGSTPGRNDPCPCGSGRKYKSCCLDVDRKALRVGVDRGSSPEGLKASRRATVWQTELVPFPAGFENDPDARPAVAVVMAGEWAVHSHVHRRPSGEPEDVAQILADAVLAVGSRVGTFPRRLEARHEEVVRDLSERLADRGVEVVRKERLHPLDAMAAEMVHRLTGGGDESPGPRACTASAETWAGWGLDRAHVRDLFEAVAAYSRARPWEEVDDELWIEVEVPEGRTWFATVLGGGGIQRGLSIQSDASDRGRLTHAAEWGPSALDHSRGRCLCVTLDHSERLPPRMRREVMRAGWPVAAPDAYPHLLTINTPGGGVSGADARDLAHVLRALAAGRPALGRAYETGDAVEWRDPATGTVVRVEEDEVAEWLRDEDPDWLRGDEDFDLGLDEFDPDEDDPDDERLWEPPSELGSGSATGAGAEPGAALELMADEDDAGREAARHERILRGFDRAFAAWSGSRRDDEAGSAARRTAASAARRDAVAMVRTFLDFLRERERIPLEALHERDLRVFLYDRVPQAMGNRFEPGAPFFDGYVVWLRSLQAFFRFLETEEGLVCRWAHPLFEDIIPFCWRWDTYPGEVEEPDEDDWPDEDDPEAEEFLRQLTDETLRRLDWDDELEADLAARVMLPEDSTADDRSWFESLPPREWDLHRELSRRWLLWREEAIAEGLTDPGAVYERALAEQRTWERTPHPRLGGRTPLEALESLGDPEM